MVDVGRGTMRPLKVVKTSAVISLIMALILVTGCTGQSASDYDAAVKQIIADYYDLDVNKIGDKAIVPACGRMAIENSWAIDNELTQRYRFMHVSSAQGEANRVAARAIIAVTGDDAPIYCEGKLKLAHSILPTLAPAPTWRVESTSVWTKGTEAENAVSPIQVDHDLRSRLVMGCFRDQVDAVFYFVHSRAGDGFMPKEFRISIDDGPPMLLDVEEARPTVSVRAIDAPYVIRLLRNGEKLVITAPRYNPDDPPGPDLRAEFDLVGLDDAINEVKCLKEKLRQASADATEAAKPPASTPVATSTPVPTIAPTVVRSATRTPDGYSINPGSSVALLPDWELIIEAENCIALERDDLIYNAAMCSYLLADGSENSERGLRQFAEERRDALLNLRDERSILEFEPMSLEPYEINGRTYQRMDYSFRFDRQGCTEDRVMMFALRETPTGLYGITLRVGVCADGGTVDETDRLAMFNGFKP